MKARDLELVFGKSKRKWSRSHHKSLASKVSENSLGSRCRLKGFEVNNLDLIRIKLLLVELRKNIQV